MLSFQLFPLRMTFRKWDSLESCLFSALYMHIVEDVPYTEISGLEKNSLRSRSSKWMEEYVVDTGKSRKVGWTERALSGGNQRNLTTEVRVLEAGRHVGYRKQSMLMATAASPLASSWWSRLLVCGLMLNFCWLSLRPDLLKSEGIPSAEAASSGSPVSGSPKMSALSGKSRYRSKPRHRRGNSKGSYNDFAGILKNQPVQDDAPPPPPHNHSHHPGLPQQHGHGHPHGHHSRLHAHGQDIANCANNLRYFGPAAALRSPLSNHAQRRMSGSSPDLISTAMEADCRRNLESKESKEDHWECCKTDQYNSCLQCREEDSGQVQMSSVETGVSHSQSPTSVSLYENAQYIEKMEEEDFSNCTSASALGTPQHMASSVLPCKARPIQKVRTAWWFRKKWGFLFPLSTKRGLELQVQLVSYWLCQWELCFVIWAFFYNQFYWEVLYQRVVLTMRVVRCLW